MALFGPSDMEYARPYGSYEHPVLQLQTIVEAYTRVRGFLGRSAVPESLVTPVLSLASSHREG